MEDKEKVLLKNTGILALGTLCSKIFTFFLLPLYTNVLSTADYGIVDVLQTISSFAMPFITFQLSSGMFRFIIDKKEFKEREKVISTGVVVEIVNICIFAIGVFIINIFLDIEYCGLFVLYFSTMALLEIVQNITRGFGNNGLYSIMSFVMTVVSLISNIVMILLLNMKGDSILIASSIAYISASMIAIFRQSLWKYIDIKYFSLKTFKELIKYCLPLIPNAVSWWITNTSDRILISTFIGVASNGVYAAANKIPTIYTTIFNVYNLAWTESLSRSLGDPDQESFINRMFEKSVRLFGCIDLGIICCMSIGFNILIGEQYKNAYPHVYILMIAIFLNSIGSLYGGIFTAFKKSDIIGSTTILGAISNILINLLLISQMGIYAASLSTLISYFIILLVRIIKIRGILTLRWPKNYMWQLLVMTIFTTIFYFYENIVFSIGFLGVLLIWSIASNKELIVPIVKTICQKYLKVNR